ncbi:hypothetical protein Cgig2_009659 [Carnegiea gigantea]|uniref:Uncharacterized protein n=1 Tax=Carnegiea gigantea TaxID=171969 RepID=A0A9Q1K2U5_9CARY|nr:hypothetical protein Cgig2_009659 [Carnegiea gigantea]
MSLLPKFCGDDNEYFLCFGPLLSSRCYLHAGDLDRGHKVFEDFANSGRPAFIELYVVGVLVNNYMVAYEFQTLAEGAMVGYTPRGMQLAQDTLVNMTARNFFLSRKMGTDLLLVAAAEKTGGYTVANYVWDLMQARNLIPFLPAVEAYYNGLRERDIPADDPRLVKVGQVLDSLRPRLGH